MYKKALGVLLIVILLAGSGMVYKFLPDAIRLIGHNEQKPVISSSDTELKIDAGTPIVLEKEYTLSNRMIISDFDYKEDIVGNSLEQIRTKYTAANGFNITLKEGSLLIHQTINDWTPEDKVKCRLKVYQGMVAVYRGPDTQNDSLLRVTAIRFPNLPANIREAIELGKYEFENEAGVNDALENLDEYL